MSSICRLRNFSCRNIWTALMLAVCIAATLSICQADVCPAPGPASKGGGNGPKDQDVASEPDAAQDVCTTLQFKVPIVPYDKTAPSGWGALVLIFDQPLDGASFTFSPNCNDATDGKLSADQMSVQLGPGAYKLGPTGTVGNGQIAPFGTFDVIVMYDSNAPKPNLSFDSFWQSKPRQGFTMVLPNDDRSNDFDVFVQKQDIVPEPSMLAAIGFFCVAFIGHRIRQRSR